MTLTWGEVMQAASVGVMRQVSNLRRARKDAHGLSGDALGWNLHVEGCLGELAVAKGLGRFWSGSLGKLRVHDVVGLQVRTRSQLTYDLILYPEDRDEDVFILVVGRAPTYRLVGWIVAKHGKVQEFWTSPAGRPPAYFVPQSALRPMAELGAEHG